MRLGFFDRFLTFFETRARDQGKAVGFRERALASLSAGGLAAGLANPAEVALVRMQSDGMKPKAERANYRSVFDALIRVARGEGLRGLYSGSYPTIIRAMSTNFGQLAFFSESKSQLKKRTNLSFQNQTILASGIAGFFAAVFSLPFDFIKTRLQRGSKVAGGPPEYKGMLDCATKVLKNEGPLRFYRGFGTYFVRIAPHSYGYPLKALIIPADPFAQNHHFDCCRQPSRYGEEGAGAVNVWTRGNEFHHERFVLPGD